MFRKTKATAIDVSKLSSLLAHDTCIRGDVVFDGGLRIDGSVDGNVLGKAAGSGLLVLSDKGSITGTVKVHDAVINGRVEGDLEVGHFIELQANARVTGNITYRALKLDTGAVVEGKLECLGGQADSEPAGEAAPPKVLRFGNAP